MTFKRDPRSLDPDLPAKRLARNRHDDVARYLVEECVFGKGHMQVSALLKSYEWWCHARGRVNRSLTAVQLLDHLLSVYGVEPGSVSVTEDDHERFVYAIPNLTFKDPSLNWRLKYQMPMTLRADLSDAGRGLKKPRKPPMTDEQKRAARKAWYAANKDRISAEYRKKQLKKRRRRR